MAFIILERMHILRRIPLWGAAALLVYMPFHLFLSQSLSLLTGGLDVWKVAKDFILIGLVLFTICLVLQQRAGTRLFYWLVGASFAFFLLHVLLWSVHPDIYQKSAVLGIIYNVRLFGFLVLGYGVALLNKDKFAFSSFLKIIIIGSTLVALLGIVQFLLPKDVLTHVGYSLDRGARPAFFIDNNETFPRVMSTLREPNALGAYLLLPCTLLTLIILRAKEKRIRIVHAVFLIIQVTAAVLTFSRSAWLALPLCMGLAAWWQYKTEVNRALKRFWPLLVAALLLVLVAGFTQRNNQFVRSYITHATPKKEKDLHSNGYHLLFLQRGLEGIADEPMGHGPGTAGIVSIQNPKGSFLTENYFVQIGYEVGIIGLALFVSIMVVVYRQLYRRHDYVGAVLLASFWGYVLTNMLLHTWSNEAVAAQWWILAGLALVAVKASQKRDAIITSSTTKRG